MLAFAACSKLSTRVRLRQHKTYAGMLDPKDGGRRCWTLQYSDESRFHLDVLPAIPDDPAWYQNKGVRPEWAATAIKITDKGTWANVPPSWPRSNPRGYAAWFKNRMKVRLEEGRRIVAMQKRADVQSVPDYEVRTPLQRLVQMLKRHRDEHYGDEDDAPISIIITTLAARAYDNEADLEQAMTNVVPRMRDHIEQRSDGSWVENPVHPSENFADKWHETPRKEELFREWLDQVESDHEALVQSIRGQQDQPIFESFARAFGVKETKAAFTDDGVLSAIITASSVAHLPAVSHRQGPAWPLALHHDVMISCRARRNGFRERSLRSGAQLPTGWSLQFEASTDAPVPYEIFWQVVNTGVEAARAGDLRGGFNRDSRIHQETTRYKGRHWVQGFLVKDGRCVALSEEFVVDVI